VGVRLTHSIASAFDFTWISQKPAISSLVSAKGPSITVRLELANLNARGLSNSLEAFAGQQHAGSHQLFMYFPISVRSSMLGITPARILAALTMINEPHCLLRLLGSGVNRSFGRI